MKQELKNMYEALKSKLTNGASEYAKVKNLKVKNNKKTERIEFRFNSIPNNLTRNYLINRGMKWDPDAKCWYAPLSEENKKVTKKVLKELK